MKPFSRFAMLVLLIGCFADVQAQDSAGERGARVARAIDQRFEKIDIHGRSVVDALIDLGSRAGITITVDEQAIELLPWGRDTRLSDLRIENATLREALQEILGYIGMEYAERGGEIVVRASGPLERINRRATWEDLELLRRCNTTEYSPEAFAAFRLQYRISSKVDAPALLSGQLAKAGRGTVAQMLEVAAGSLGWTWFPNKDHLVIMTNQAQIAHRLARRFTYRYSNQPLSHILADLAKRANVALNLEPGMMRKLPPSIAQSSNLVLQQASIRQALEILCAETGLKYSMERDGLSVGLAEDASDASAGGAARRSPYVCKISVPSKDGSFAYEFLVRESELPDDILEYRRQIVEATIEKMRAEMAPDGSIRTGSADGP